MHTVIADECTGCELCIAPCPVDCIAMVPATMPADAEKYRARYTAHMRRERRRDEERAAELAARKSKVDAGDAVAAALVRARAKKTGA
jgi:electron transport complex protein RnfB